MSHIALRYLLMCLLIMPMQALVFNHMVLFNVAIPLAAVFLIVALPVTLSTNWSLTVGFAIGLAIDVFSDTQGLNATACTVAVFARKPLFHLFHSGDDDLAGRMPSTQNMGVPDFVKYASVLSLVYCLVFFVIEAFQLFNPLILVLRIIFSTIYTFVLVYALNCLTLRQPQREKKL